MREFGVSLRFGMMICMVSRVKQSIWKCLGLRLKIWLWESEREDYEMSKGYGRIGTYFTTQGIHQEIKSCELTTQGNPPKR